jgi:hypothetical protein
MAIEISRELSASPRKGSLPLDCTLSFNADAPDADTTIDVIYRIVETKGQELDIAFKTDAGPAETVRKNGVQLTALTHAVTKSVTFQGTGTGEEATLVVVQASLVKAGAVDDSDPIEQTATVVKIQ